MVVMLDLFMKLIDRLIQLTKTRAERRDKRFALVSSVYKELMAVHGDYLRFLERAKADLAAGKPVKDVFDAFLQERLVFEPTRRSLMAAARQFMGEDRRVNYGAGFFVALGAYLTIATDWTKPPRRGSTYSERIVDNFEKDLLSGKAEDEIRKRMISRLGWVLKRARNRYGRVSAQYAALLVRSV